MPTVRTSIRPDEDLVVSVREARDLRQMGLLLTERSDDSQPAMGDTGEGTEPAPADTATGSPSPDTRKGKD